MRVLKFLSLALLFAGATVFTSCEKDENNDDNTSVESQLVGKWMGNEFYEDGVLSPYNDFYKISYNEFKADGTGTFASPFGEQPLTWSYNATNHTLKIVTETVTEVSEGVEISIDGETIEAAEILKLDDSNLWYTYEDDGVVYEEHLMK